jgi:hypothetical protein
MSVFGDSPEAQLKNGIYDLCNQLAATMNCLEIVAAMNEITGLIIKRNIGKSSTQPGDRPDAKGVYHHGLLCP